MRKSYLLLLALLCVLLAPKAHGQYQFTDSSLGSYRQSFDNLTGNLTMAGNQVSAIPNVYAEANFSGTSFQPTLIYPNNGSIPNANYYHFGYSSGASTNERALGGIGGFLSSTNPVPGIGYVGIRFRNNSSQVIKNLEIGYAMEQWYNSTFTTAAQVAVAYQVSNTALTSLITGTWTDIAALGVAAPSTATSVGARDGNAASNRQQLNTILNGINLQPNDEIMIRWAYALNSNTNGNGLSIDDVVVTPETNVFYSTTTGDLNKLSNWHTSSDGTGTSPTSFGDDNQVFFVQSTDGTVASAIDRIGVELDNVANTVWTVSGANSKIVVGTMTAPAALRVVATKNVVGTIDVGSGSYLYHNHPSNPTFTLGMLAATSTVEFNSSDAAFSIPANVYGNLKASGTSSSDPTSSQKQLAGNIVVTGSLELSNDSKLVLGSFNLTLLSPTGFSTYSPSAYVVTNGIGRLRIRVPRASSATVAGTKVTFPVGATAISYTPITVQQTSTASDDVFETGVIDNVFRTYNTSTFASTGPQVTAQVVNKTWFIRKEVPANPATLDITLQWNEGESPSAPANTSDYLFVNATAHINSNKGTGWDTYTADLGVGASPVGGPFVARRKGFASSGTTPMFAFGVSSRANGALPVTLVSFEAKRLATSVRCAWATATELNSNYFVVERSADSEIFTDIARVAGAGSSALPLQYSFEDKAPLPGTAYYRLRQTDIDGKVSFSPVAVVRGGSPATQAVAVPNPSPGQFVVAVPAAEVVATEVTTVLGTVVPTPATATPEGTLRFDLSGQPAGLYFVRLHLKTGTQMVRVVRN